MFVKKLFKSKAVATFKKEKVEQGEDHTDLENQDNEDDSVGARVPEAKLKKPKTALANVQRSFRLFLTRTLRYSSGKSEENGIDPLKSNKKVRKFVLFGRKKHQRRFFGSNSTFHNDDEECEEIPDRLNSTDVHTNEHIKKLSPELLKLMEACPDGTALITSESIKSHRSDEEEVEYGDGMVEHEHDHMNSDHSIDCCDFCGLPADKRKRVHPSEKDHGSEWDSSKAKEDIGDIGKSKKNCTCAHSKKGKGNILDPSFFRPPPSSTALKLKQADVIATSTFIDKTLTSATGTTMSQVSNPVASSTPSTCTPNHEMQSHISSASTVVNSTFVHASSSSAVVMSSSTNEEKNRHVAASAGHNSSSMTLLTQKKGRFLITRTDSCEAIPNISTSSSTSPAPQNIFTAQSSVSATNAAPIATTIQSVGQASFSTSSSGSSVSGDDASHKSDLNNSENRLLMGSAHARNESHSSSIASSISQSVEEEKEVVIQLLRTRTGRKFELVREVDAGAQSSGYNSSTAVSGSKLHELSD